METLNKENINKIDSILYTKLEKDNEFDKIVRHYKIIKQQFNKCEQNKISHETDNKNVYYVDATEIDNNYITDNVSFNTWFENSDELLNHINNSISNSYNNYVNNLLNEDFSDEEKEEINNYINEEGDKYIRFGIKKIDKNKYLKQLLNIYLGSYFNNLDEENKNSFINNIKLLPMINHNIFYSNAKYDYIKTKIEDK